MTFDNPNLSDMQRAVRDAFGAHWRLMMFQGVIMIILGVLAVAAPVIATIAIDIWVGWLFLFSGVIGLIALFSSHHIPAFLWSLITAALSRQLSMTAPAGASSRAMRRHWLIRWITRCHSRKQSVMQWAWRRGNR